MVSMWSAISAQLLSTRVSCILATNEGDGLATCVSQRAGPRSSANRKTQQDAAPGPAHGRALLTIFWSAQNLSFASSSCSRDSKGLQEVRVAPGMMTGNPSPPAMVAVAIVEQLLQGRARGRRAEGRTRLRARSIAGVKIACCARRLCFLTPQARTAAPATAPAAGRLPPSAPIPPSNSTRARGPPRVQRLRSRSTRAARNFQMASRLTPAGRGAALRRHSRAVRRRWRRSHRGSRGRLAGSRRGTRPPPPPPRPSPGARRANETGPCCAYAPMGRAPHAQRVRAPAARRYAWSRAARPPRARLPPRAMATLAAPDNHCAGFALQDSWRQQFPLLKGSNIRSCEKGSLT